jgi:F0F1-type ATP synthase membrane subunit c/vacuolar-type H+-ATPase subunit K
LLIFIFSEALALYGLIVGIILASAGAAAVKPA